MARYIEADSRQLVVETEDGELHAPWASILNITDTGTGLKIGWVTGMGVTKVNGPHDGVERARVIRCFLNAKTSERG